MSWSSSRDSRSLLDYKGLRHLLSPSPSVCLPIRTEIKGGSTHMLLAHVDDREAVSNKRKDRSVTRELHH